MIAVVLDRLGNNQPPKFADFSVPNSPPAGVSHTAAQVSNVDTHCKSNINLIPAKLYSSQLTNLMSSFTKLNLTMANWKTCLKILLMTFYLIEYCFSFLAILYFSLYVLHAASACVCKSACFLSFFLSFFLSLSSLNLVMYLIYYH